jgi:hypothetical protein
MALLGSSIYCRSSTLPLRDPDYFARVALDRKCGTVVWPNGADFAPHALRDLLAAREA